MNKIKPTTTIQISLATKKLLLELMNPQESYDTVVSRNAKEVLGKESKKL
jgi:hypothetical protein